MTGNITIRAVPDEVRSILAERAKEEGRSLQEYLSRELASLAARPSLEDAISLARTHARGMPALGPDDISRDLDADRR